MTDTMREAFEKLVCKGCYEPRHHMYPEDYADDETQWKYEGFCIGYQAALATLGITVEGE